MNTITFNTGFTKNLPQRKFNNYIDAITYAIQVKAPLIVKTLAGTFYVKGNENTDYEDCKKILKRNIREEFKPRSICNLIKYI